MTRSLISAWLSAGALALGTAALIAAPSLLSAALPPVSEVAEPEILTIGDPETQIEVEDLYCFSDSLSLTSGFDCDGARVDSLAFDTPSDLDLALQRTVRAAHLSLKPTKEPVTGPYELRWLELDASEAKDLLIEGLEPEDEIYAFAAAVGDRTVAAVVAGNFDVADQVAYALATASEGGE